MSVDYARNLLDEQLKYRFISGQDYDDTWDGILLTASNWSYVRNLLDEQLKYGVISGQEYDDALDVLDEKVRQKQAARHRQMWWAIGLGLLGALATLAALAILFQEDPPAAPTLQEVGDSAGQPVEGPEEPLSGSELAEADELLVDTSELVALTAYFDCPEDFQMDVNGRRLSGMDGEQRESDTETEIDRGANPICSRWRLHSHEFTVIVEGDGETLSMADNTSYQVSFIVNNKWPENEFYDDTGFSVHVSWQHLAQAFAGQVLNADQFNPQPIEGAKIDIEWLDQSTLQVVVDIPGDQVDVTEVRTELNVNITDEAGSFVYERFDVAIWKTEP